MPRIVPRIREFFASGFGWIAFTMAFVFAGVRLLPPNHPYLQGQNFGRFGIRHVVAEAANRLEFKRENIDQIVVFGALLVGFVLLVLQFAMLALSFFIHPALAQDAASGGFTSFFKTNSPTDDIAYELLDKVFAIPGMFGSKYDPGTGGVQGINAGLQKLIKFYNTAMLIVGVAIFIYYLIVVVAETANTGTPFGRRFSHIYAPLRLVIAVGLLIPLNYGYNSAQYITLFAAKFGSSLATNTWLLFNTTIDQKGGKNPLGAPAQTLIGRPQSPDVAGLISAMVLIKTCADGYKVDYQPSGAPGDTQQAVNVMPYLVWGGSQQALMATVDYADAAGPTMFNSRDIVVTFGDKNQTAYPQQPGYVSPKCGTVRIPVTVAATAGGGTDSQAGAIAMQKTYYDLVLELWNDAEIEQFAQRFVALDLIKDTNKNQPEKVTISPSGKYNSGAAADNSTGAPGEAIRNDLLRSRDQAMQTAANTARDEMVKNVDADNYDAIKTRGWGGAAIWYNRLASWNGAYFGAVFNVPQLASMPDIMQAVQRERGANSQSSDPSDMYNPGIANGQPINIPPGDRAIAGMLNDVYKYFQTDTPAARNDSRPDGGVLNNIINRVFPYNALMDIRYNVDIHPLAQLVGLGKAIIDTSLGNLAGGLIGAAGGGFLSGIGGSKSGALVSMFSGAWISITTVALTIGFTLYYVLPFMPFIYFFFAVGGWVKSIFEAMVGVPLWALAHLRIDGEGLPGDRAMDGYFLIFEIFLRPVLILFGLLGGLLIFSAMARTLHDIFGLLTTNVGGFDQAALAPSSGYDVAEDKADALKLAAANRGSPMDEFFYTIVYTIIVYSMALSSFKLIDRLPDTIMRWLGAGVHSFATGNSEPAEQFMGKIAIADQIINQNIIKGLHEGAAGVGESAGSATGMVARGLFGRNKKEGVTLAGGKK